ncbi:MAG: PilN domain-containing protein [Phycisphaerales bacterium]|nr:PilN domain-containing protein [Phycisphaerales bacterium]
MQKTRLAIELAPDRLEVARVRGRAVVGAARRWIAPALWETAWREGLYPLDALLREVLNELGVQAGLADAFHHGPDATSELHSHMLPADAARQATLLAMADQLGVGLADQPHDVRVLASAHIDQHKRQSHVLFSGDSEHGAEVICDWLARGGVETSRLAPMQSVHIDALLKHVCTSVTDPTVALRLGEHKSAIVVVAQGKVRLARTLALGVSRLTDSVARPIMTHDGREIALSHEEARTLVFEHGVPQRDDVLQPWNLGATDVLPAIQPVLQRCLVELRQSLRFGLDEADRTSARLLVMGPGAAIPRLADVLAQELHLHAEAAGVAGFEHTVPACVGSDLFDAINGKLAISLLPNPIAQERTMSRLRAALICGAAAALALGGGQMMLWSAKAGSIRSEAGAFGSQVAQLHELEALRDRASARTVAVQSTEQAIARALGPTPGIAGFMRELPAILPNAVELLDLRCARDETGARVEISASALAQAGTTPSTKQISALVAALEASPLVDKVHLGNTQATVLDDHAAMQFTLEVHLHGVPAALMALGDLDGEVTP